MSVHAIARCEIARLFRQPQAWLVLALGQGLMAVCFLLLVIRYIEQQADLAGAGVSVEIVARYFTVANLSILLLAPILTMASVAGDKRDGMLRFLYTTPLTTRAIVLGKYCGVLALIGVYALLCVLMPVTLWWGAAVDSGVYLTNVCGLALFTTMHSALGVLASALTRSPLGSALLALSVSLVLWSAEWAARLDAQASTLGSWSSLTRLRGFNQGLLLSADAVYFVAASVLFLVLAVVLVDGDRRLT